MSQDERYYGKPSLTNAQLKAKKRRTYQPVQRVEDEKGRPMVGTIMYQNTVDQKNAEIHGYMERTDVRVDHRRAAKKAGSSKNEVRRLGV